MPSGSPLRREYRDTFFPTADTLPGIQPQRNADVLVFVAKVFFQGVRKMHGFPRLRALTIAFSAGMGIFGSRTGSYRSSLTAQGLPIASSGSAIWKLTRLEGFGKRFKVQD
jgi:hypothetical protein